MAKKVKKEEFKNSNLMLVFVSVLIIIALSIIINNINNDVPENAHICTAEEKAAEFCTLEYNPVCGDDGETYGNACAACSSKNINYYVLGEC
ncbi:MAG: Kazal-type serine protease inhibitor [Candidatus Nanoarchaeia archaeon]|nr:Kazal-type serine protease inhibitor [Candidatus Nanoarchaeia archaeon]MDD5499398.1 Kazal-type serine protease inhibitor [Candidatus Nanoarchaeia archaeon]